MADTSLRDARKAERDARKAERDARNALQGAANDPYHRGGAYRGDTAVVTGGRFLRLPGVIAKTGLSRSSIYEGMAAGWFPRSASLGSPRARGWWEPEIDAYNAARLAERDRGPK